MDHSIFRAFNKGALGMMKIVGPDAPKVFAQIKGLPMAGGRQALEPGHVRR